MDERARATGVHAAIGALLMLAYGWGMGGFSAVSSAGKVYLLAVDAFNAMLKFGGVAMAISAGVCLAGQRPGLLMDAIVSGLCGAIMIVCSLVWILSGGGFDIQDVFILIFGGLFLSGAKRSFVEYGLSAKVAARPATATSTVEAPSAPHPASIRPTSLGALGEEPPPDGYLAALSKEEDEPPTASFE